VRSLSGLGRGENDGSESDKYSPSIITNRLSVYRPPLLQNLPIVDIAERRSEDRVYDRFLILIMVPALFAGSPDVVPRSLPAFSVPVTKSK
jgi:hypothetical protein